MAEESKGAEAPTMNIVTSLTNDQIPVTLTQNAGTSVVNTETPVVNVGIPILNAQTPVVEVPNIDIVTQDSVEVPSVIVETQALNVELPTVSADTPVVNAETPIMNSGTGSKDAAPVPKDTSDRDCAVCLETMVQPTELPCKHVFCFLCVKGIAQKTRCCALCRREIPLNYFDRPHLLNDPAPEKEKGKSCSDDEDKPLWYYKGRSGWWQYDDRTSQELEDAFSKGARSCEVLIAGYLYNVDFTIMTQVRKDDPIRRRAVRRDTERAIPVKGVAGVHASNKFSGPPPKKAKHDHPTSSYACDVSGGPSCSLLVINFAPSDGPSTCHDSGSKQKDSESRRKVPSNAQVDEVIILSSGDSSDFDGFSNSDDSDDVDDFDDSDSSDDGDAPRFVQSFHLDSSGRGPGKKELNSAEYKTALELMKAEHNHVKESLKLKHIRSLVDKKTPREIKAQKKQNYAEFRKLERKQNEEHRKFLRQHRDIDDLYD